jgi:hypothetical protein
MKKLVESIGDNPDQIPSSNILRLFERLESDDPNWMEILNNEIRQ